MEIKGRKFSVIGMARSGLAAATKLSTLGADVFISESKPESKITSVQDIKQKFPCEFNGHTSQVLNSDVIILSPGVPQSIPILQEARQNHIEIISEIEFGYRIKAADSRLICCTGSNGKSTTVSLIHHILENCGYNSILAGNIGTPFTAYPIEKSGIDFIVLELSSFQLELVDKFKADTAIILNITPDHLDRYDSFEHYAATKFNIFLNQTSSDTAILNLDDPFISDRARALEAKVKWFSLRDKSDCRLAEEQIVLADQTFSLADISLRGPHNIMNTMAALLAVTEYATGKETEVRKALKTFESLPHRLETVSYIDGVRFVNDSKATNTDSVKYALQSFTENIHIILGGSDKGEDFGVLIPFLHKRNVIPYLMGATRDRMQNTFAGKLNIVLCENLADAVQKAYQNARSGDIVLLSPACASYDAFDNYIDRGESFKKLVNGLTDGQYST